MLEIIPIRALRDNYIWLLTNTQTRQAAVVDPGDAEPVKRVLQEQHLHLSSILLTHHHADHSGGIKDLMELSNEIEVVASHRSLVSSVNRYVKEGDEFDLLGAVVRVIEIPGHTLDHTAYYIQNEALFSGDTLFSAGCGRVFEGTPDMMYHSLTKLIILPERTAVYCGHEYTLKNLAFSKLVEPDNVHIQDKIDKLIRAGSEQCSLPSNLKEERQINPFLRCHITEVIQAAEHYAGKSLTTPAAVFAILREWKNSI